MRPEEIVIIVTGTTTWSRNEMETGGATMKSVGKQRLGPGLKKNMRELCKI